jgi:glycosyltransferase involved in cell wall biosynthesis
MGVPFIADMRDPWASNPGYRWPGSARLDARSLRLHREVMETAAATLNVSDPITAESRGAGASRAVTVPNGFDPADLPAWDPAPGPLRIAFMGRFYGSTDPTPFFDGVARAIQRGGAAADLVVDVVGQMSAFVSEAITSRGIGERFIAHGFLPHAQALGVVSGADAGLVALTDHPGAEANYTGKLFEYLGMGLPVLLVGPAHGVAAALLRESRAGITVPYGDADGVADVLERMAEEKRTGTCRFDPDATVIERFDRRVQASFVATLLDEVVATP